MNCPAKKKISVAVLTFNSEKTILKCLTAIINIDYPSELLEIIILDNGSTDRTTEIITEMGFSFYDFPEKNLSQLRNTAVNLSHGEIVGFIDSDCIVSPDWVKVVVKWFDDPQVGLVGNEYLLPDDASYFEKNWYGKFNHSIKENELIPAGNMAIHKYKFIKVGGFDENLLTGEDAQILEAFRSAGYKTILDHRIKSIHLGNARNLVDYFRKETWYGLGMLGTAKQNIFDKPFVLSNTYLLLIIFFLITLGFSVVHEGLYLRQLVLLSFTGLIGIPFLAAIERVFIKKRKGNLLYVTIVFIVFFLARINSLKYIYGLKQYKRT